MQSSFVLRVALPVPLPQLFDYLPPRDGPAAVPGARVLVPFGRRKLVGIVVAESNRSSVARERLLRIEKSLDDGEAVLDPSLVGLLSWCWRYYNVIELVLQDHDVRERARRCGRALD